MNDEEKRAFLKKMGYAGSSMRAAEETIIKKKKPVAAGEDDLPRGHVYKSDLLALNRIFNQRPDGPKRQEIYKDDDKKDPS